MLVNIMISAKLARRRVDVKPPAAYNVFREACAAAVAA